MTDFRERYKRVGFGREDVSANRALRSQRRDEARREMRDEHFSFLRRDLEEAAQNDSLDAEVHQHQHDDDDAKKKAAAELEAAVQKRLLQLEKWREERQRRKIEQKKKAKPAFKVGVVHHKVYSPPLCKEPVPPPPPKLCRLREVHPEPPPPKRVTRATEKRLAVKAVTNHRKRENLRVKKEDKVESTTNDAGLDKVAFAPKDHQFRAPVGVTPLPLFGRQALEATRHDLQLESDSKVSSTSNELPTSLSIGSENVFSSGNHTKNLSKSKTRSSKIHRSGSHLDDKIIKKDKSNNSTVESITLKLSSDDPDVLHGQENLSFSVKTDTSFTKYMESPGKKRRSSRVFTPPVTDSGKEEIPIPEDQKGAENEENVNSSDKDASFLKQNRSRKRSSKILSPPIELSTHSESKTNSAEDQEMMDVQSDAQFNPTNDSFSMDSSFSKQNKTKSPVNKRRSTRIFTNDMVSPEKTVNGFMYAQEDQEMSDQQEDNESSCKNASSSVNSSIPKLNTTQSSTTKRRSTKLFAGETESSTQPKEVSLRDQQVLDNHEDIHFDSKNASAMESSFSKQNKRKSLVRRRSTKLSSQSSTEDTPTKSNFSKEQITKGTENQEVDSNFDNNTGMDSTFSKQDKTESPTNHRRSTKMSFIESLEEPAKESSFTLQDQDLLENQENVDSNSIDLMGSLIIQPKSSSVRKKSTRTINLLEQSLTGFSPRRSLRPPPSRKTDVPIDQSLIKFSPVSRVEPLNESSSSEPTKHKTPEKSEDNSQNFSLNMSLEKDVADNKPPAFFSPYIVTSRGKSSVRKEVQRRRFSQPAVNAEIPTKDTVMQNLNISVDEEERTAQYYKYILDKEIERLNEVCAKWNVIKENEGPPEDTHYEIQAAVGQTNLLINKKFERFRGLVLDCETGKGEMLVTCKDLQGFWDMMYMEIKDCDSRFSRLEELRARNWEGDESEKMEVKQPKKKPIVKKPVAKKKPAAAAKTSSLRAHIMAARKKKMGAQEPVADVEMIEAPIPEKSDRVEEENKDAVPSSPSTESLAKPSRHTSTPKSANKWQSLLKKVQLSQTRKSTTSPLIVMKLSQMCKTPEIQLDDSIVYINSDRTPAKSILKTSNDTISKSINKVFFKEQPSEIQEFHLNDEGNTDDNMCIDDVEEAKAPIERRLDFDNDSFNISHTEENQEAVKSSKENSSSPATSPKSFTVPKIGVTISSPKLSISSLNLNDTNLESSIAKKATRKTKKQISFKENTDESYTRTLRSSKFSAPPTPKPKFINSLKETGEETSMDVDESVQEKMDDASFSASEQNVQKELYLNSDGIICERMVPIKKATPRTPRIKRSNSERSAKNNVTTTEALATETPPKTRLRRRNTLTPGSMLDSPLTLDSPGDMSTESATPRTRGKRSLKRSVIDSTLTEDNVNVTLDEATVPKLRRTPKIAKNNTDLNDSIQKSSVSKSRTKTLNITKNDKDINESIEEPTTPKLRKNSKMLDTTKSYLEEKSTPSLRRKSSKKIQENLQPNGQETDHEMKESTKVSRTPSLRSRNSKKTAENVESTEQQTVLNKDVSEAMTPNTRRKSSRRAHVSMRSED